jgi:sugar phosphate isomerase/epimerase
MIRNPLGLRLDPGQPIRAQIHEAARLGTRGVVLDAVGDLAPHRLGETGRRELRHLLRTVELSLIALSLPTRRPFDTTDQLEDRIRRADSAFAMAYELGTNVVLARAGAVPPSEDAARREIYTNALRALAERSDHRGVRLALETGPDPGEKLQSFLETLGLATLAVSIDPASLLQVGIDPVAAVRALAGWVAHAYANDATGVSGAAALNPRGFGYPPGALDWEEYLGALEEIGYHGFLTVWPAPGRAATTSFAAIAEQLKQIAQ